MKTPKQIAEEILAEDLNDVEEVSHLPKGAKKHSEKDLDQDKHEADKITVYHHTTSKGQKHTYHMWSGEHQNSGYWKSHGHHSADDIAAHRAKQVAGED